MISEKMTYTLALRRFLEGKEEKPSRKKQRAKKEKKRKKDESGKSAFVKTHLCSM